jgi:hypothetical protein
VEVEPTARTKARLEDPVLVDKVVAQMRQPWEQQTPVLVVVVVMAKEGLMEVPVLSLFVTLPPQIGQSI